MFVYIGCLSEYYSLGIYGWCLQNENKKTFMFMNAAACQVDSLLGERDS